MGSGGSRPLLPPGKPLCARALGDAEIANAQFGMIRLVALSPMKHRSASTQTAWVLYGQASRPISTSRLHVLPHFDLWPINLVVYQGSYSLKGMGELISRPASRLDAFSGYPIRT